MHFEVESAPYREIGLNQTGEPILVGPDERNYGFWLDTELTLKDFEGSEISKGEFVKIWNSYFGEGSKHHAF